MQFNDVQLQYESLRDEIDAAIRQALASGRYIFGPSMTAFEEEFARYTRSADAIMAKTDLAGWTRGTCPLCAGEPDFAVITPAADRILICGRCSAR